MLVISMIMIIIIIIIIISSIVIIVSSSITIDNNNDNNIKDRLRAAKRPGEGGRRGDGIVAKLRNSSLQLSILSS